MVRDLEPAMAGSEGRQACICLRSCDLCTAEDCLYICYGVSDLVLQRSCRGYSPDDGLFVEAVVQCSCLSRFFDGGKNCEGGFGSFPSLGLTAYKNTFYFGRGAQLCCCFTSCPLHCALTF